MIWQVEPLTAWPWPVTRSRKSSVKFRASWTDTIALLEREVEHLGVRGAVAIRAWCAPGDIRRDGQLRANARISRPGVVVSFESRHGPLSYPCDTYEQSYYREMPGWQANIRAIALSLEALRAVDRHGVAGHGEQYAGWRAIEPSKRPFDTADQAVRWLGEVTGMPVAAPVQDLLRKGAKVAHPDHCGGDRSLWDLYDAARQILNVQP